LLEFRPGDPSLARLQADLHLVALAYVHSHCPAVAPLPELSPASRRLGLFGRLRASLLNEPVLAVCRALEPRLFAQRDVTAQPFSGLHCNN
jgi:hypothetical protein